jgi:hypothetical protein
MQFEPRNDMITFMKDKIKMQQKKVLEQRPGVEGKISSNTKYKDWLWIAALTRGTMWMYNRKAPKNKISILSYGSEIDFNECTHLSLFALITGCLQT